VIDKEIKTMKRLYGIATVLLLLILVPTVFASHQPGLISGSGGGGECSDNGQPCVIVHVTYYLGSLNPNLDPSSPHCQHLPTIRRPIYRDALFVGAPGEVDAYEIEMTCLALPGDPGPGHSGDGVHHHDTSSGGSNGISAYAPGQVNDGGASQLSLGQSSGSQSSDAGGSAATNQGQSASNVVSNNANVGDESTTSDNSTISNNASDQAVQASAGNTPANNAPGNSGDHRPSDPPGSIANQGKGKP
jgi:hypothetical protein